MFWRVATYIQPRKVYYIFFTIFLFYFLMFFFFINNSSVETRCRMRFSVYLPPQAHAECALGEPGSQAAVRRPVLYWLSGLTCTEENFIIKSGFQRYSF